MLAAPLKSSAKTWVQPDGVGGSDAWAAGGAASQADAAAITAASAAANLRMRRWTGAGGLRVIGSAPLLSRNTIGGESAL